MISLNAITLDDFLYKINEIVNNVLLEVINLCHKCISDSLNLLIENKIASISGLATSSALPAVENKIPNVWIFKKQIKALKYHWIFYYM